MQNRPTAFGSVMQTRSFSSVAYRFGMNTQEKEQELGDGMYSAGFWMYDGKLGRRWNVDPMTSRGPHLSPYQTMNNNPILFLDPNGLWHVKEGQENKEVLEADKGDSYKSLMKYCNDNKITLTDEHKQVLFDVLEEAENINYYNTNFFNVDNVDVNISSVKSGAAKCATMHYNAAIIPDKELANGESAYKIDRRFWKQMQRQDGRLLLYEINDLADIATKSADFDLDGSSSLEVQFDYVHYDFHGDTDPGVQMAIGTTQYQVDAPLYGLFGNILPNAVDFTSISKYSNVGTKIISGGCNLGDASAQPMLESLSAIHNGAWVYGHQGYNMAPSLYINGSYGSKLFQFFDHSNGKGANSWYGVRKNVINGGVTRTKWEGGDLIIGSGGSLR